MTLLDNYRFRMERDIYKSVEDGDVLESEANSFIECFNDEAEDLVDFGGMLVELDYVPETRMIMVTGQMRLTYTAEIEVSFLHNEDEVATAVLDAYNQGEITVNDLIVDSMR